MAKRSFAAQGVLAALEQAGYDVACFSRGEESRTGYMISGPVKVLHKNPYPDDAYDTVINYIVLKNESIEDNIAYLSSLLQFCRDKSVRHLVHISSLSVYLDTLALVNEEAAIKTNPSLSGAYASLKVAAEAYLRQQLPPKLHLSLIRPAFILGNGLSDPVGSGGIKLPNERILVLGNPEVTKPLIARSVLNRAVVQIASDPPQNEHEVLLMVDPNSPSNGEYLKACCKVLENRKKVVTWPMVWIPIAAVREMKKGMNWNTFPRIVRTIQSRRLRQDFDPSWTERRLGFHLSSDWKAELNTNTTEAV